MSSIPVCVDPTESHVGPVLTAARAFVENGWRVRVLTGAAFLTNGGYGGLHEAMRHGVPIDVAGDTEDKLDTSARVAWSGAGLNLRTGHPTPETIRTAVREVLAKRQYRDASACIGADIAASPGAAGFADAVQQLVSGRAAQTPARW